MINFGFTFASLLGLVNIILALIYIVFSRSRWKRSFRVALNPALYILQSIVMPILLIVVGLIFILFGWRLDPILQFCFVLQNALIIYIGFKDIYIFNLLFKHKQSID